MKCLKNVDSLFQYTSNIEEPFWSHTFQNLHHFSVSNHEGFAIRAKPKMMGPLKSQFLTLPNSGPVLK